MQAGKSIFITGCNRGLGLETVKLVLKLHPDMHIHTTCRNNTHPLLKQLLEKHGKQITNHIMDINDHETVTKVASALKDEGKCLDFIVANAAVGDDGSAYRPSMEIATNTMNTNVDSTIHFIKTLLPLLTATGRVIVVSSQLSALNRQKERIRKLLDNPEVKQEQILELSSAYCKAANQGQMGDFNWSAYSTSKCLINAWTRHILPKHLKEGQSFICMHPGWCSTDMGGKGAPLSPQKGGERIYEAMWIKDVPKDQFFSQTKFVSYDVCE